jgi:hypothetical protein
MTNPFAAIETSINAACIGALANVSATIGAATVSGLFRQAYADAASGLAAGSSPVFDCLASAVPTIARGNTVTINSVNYTVLGIEPDGAGWVSLILQKA